MAQPWLSETLHAHDLKGWHIVYERRFEDIVQSELGELGQHKVRVRWRGTFNV